MMVGGPRQQSSGENTNNEILHLAQTSTTLNRKENYGPQAPNKVTLKIIGDLNTITKDWSLEELHDCRRLVIFRKSLIGSTLQISFRAVSSNGEPQPDSFCISCIKGDAIGGYYFTEDDIIGLIEWLRSWPSPYRYSAEQKTHVIHSLKDFHPLTVSKIRAETEDLFKLIMGLSNPQPSNLNVDIRVLYWETLLPALETIMGGDDELKLPETPELRSKEVFRAAPRRVFRWDSPSSDFDMNVGRSASSKIQLPSINGEFAAVYSAQFKDDHYRRLTPFVSTWIDSGVTTDVDHSYQTKFIYKPGDWNYSKMSSEKHEKYNSWLADSLFTAVRDISTDQNARNRVLSILPELLEAFALRIGYNVPAAMRHDIENFILRNRE